MGGLAGAILHEYAAAKILLIIFAVLLILAGLYGLFGQFEHVRFGHRSAWVGGFLTGIFGGLVGE